MCMDPIVSNSADARDSYVMTFPPRLSRSTRRRLLLGTDWPLSKLERLYVAGMGGRRRFKRRGDIDKSTGRTKFDLIGANRLGPTLADSAGEALTKGADPAELAQAIDEAVTDAVPSVIDALQAAAPQMHREHRLLRQAARRRSRAIWGPAFDAFYEVYVCAEEIGSNLQQLHGPGGDAHTASLLALNARACLVLNEVHTLLVEGFPLGAQARCRSLHETAIIATVISDSASAPETADLGERFLRHGIVDQARDLELAHEHGIHVDTEELEAVRSLRAEAIDDYGSGFKHDYGWARPLFPTLTPKARVTFAQIEQLAETGLSRLDYRLGGHHIHSSGWTIALNMFERGGQDFRLTGPINIGFTEPAAVALTSSRATTSALIYGIDVIPDPMDLVALRTLNELSNRTIELFAEGQALVDERERRLQERQRDSSADWRSLWRNKRQ